jgi:hypothetical protein
VQGIPIFEKFLMKHGVNRFRIAPSPNRGGVGQRFPSEGHGRNTYKKQKDLSFKIFFMFYY